MTDSERLVLLENKLNEAIRVDGVHALKSDIVQLRYELHRGDFKTDIHSLENRINNLEEEVNLGLKASSIFITTESMWKYLRFYFNRKVMKWLGIRSYLD